jgi:uncharacterized protein
MTDALSRTTPQIDHPAELEQLLEQIVAKLDPVAVYLFGSRARGDADKDSDYDLMAIVQDDVSDEALKSEWSFPPRTSPVDMQTWRRTRFVNRMGRVGTLEHDVACDGLQLYPLGPNPFDFEKASHPRRDMPPDAEIVREWIGRARWHVPGAENLSSEVPETAAFYLQQAAENLTKAALVAHRIRPPSGHSIGEAVAKLPLRYRDRGRFLALDHLSDCFWAYRYPSPPGTQLPPKPSSEDVKRWLEQIEQLAEDLERWLAEREAAP